MSAAVRTVAICGSCITRDNFNSKFNAEHRRWYSVVAQANQSSMIALMAPPVEPEVTEADGLSDYDVWNVGSDLSKSFLSEVVAAQPDFLILDFFGDLHFGVLELDDTYVTDNGWKLHRTAQYLGWGPRATLKPLDDPERYFALWTEAMDRFAAYMAAHCPTTTVIVHRGFYADKVAGPVGRPRSLRKFAKLAPIKVRRLNEFWARLDEHAVTSYGWRSIDLTRERYTSTADHPWGAFWVHYSLDYYHRFLAELHTFDLTERLDADAGEAVIAIDEAGVELLRARATFVRKAVRSQAERLTYLTRRGPVRGARDARHARHARKKVSR